MTNTPGSGWPGAPPPQGPGSNPHQWGTQPGGRAAHDPYQPGHPPYPPPQQPPQPQQQNPYPYGAPDPHAAPGFDPRRALGEQPPASVSISQFAPPPNRTPVLITVAALITLVLVIAGGIYVRSLPGADPSPSAGPSQSASAGPGHPFTTPDGQQSGRWEILDSAWTDEGLQLELRIHSDKGPITFSFMAFANASTDLVTPTSSPRSPDIRTGTASPARAVTGYVFFPMARGDATIILANGAGRQMSAQLVKG